MIVSKLLALTFGVWAFLHAPRETDERGLSQSTENAVLLAGAVAIATIVITLITGYVRTKIPK